MSAKTYDIRIQLVRRDLFPCTREEQLLNPRAIAAIEARSKEYEAERLVSRMPDAELKNLLPSGKVVFALPEKAGEQPVATTAVEPLVVSADVPPAPVDPETVVLGGFQIDLSKTSGTAIEIKINARSRMERFSQFPDWLVADIEAYFEGKVSYEEENDTYICDDEFKQRDVDIISNKLSELWEKSLAADQARKEFGEKYQLHITAQEAGLEEELVKNEM